MSRWETRSRGGQRRDLIKIHILSSAHVQFGLTSASIYFRKDFALSVSAFTNVPYPVSDCWILTYHICFCYFPSFPWSDLIILFKLDFSLPMKSFFLSFLLVVSPWKLQRADLWKIISAMCVCVLEGRSWRFRKWLIRELLLVRLQFNVLSICPNSRNLLQWHSSSPNWDTYWGLKGVLPNHLQDKPRHFVSKKGNFNNCTRIDI